MGISPDPAKFFAIVHDPELHPLSIHNTRHETPDSVIETYSVSLGVCKSSLKCHWLT